MARDLSAAVITALGQTVIRPAYLVDLDTTAGHVRAWSGIGSLFWGGSPANEFLGVGKLGSISVIGETRDIRAEGIVIRLSGIPADMVSLALDQARPGLTVLVYIAMFTDAGVLIVDPYLSFSGLTDSVTMLEGGDSSTIEIACESELIRLQRANETRYTHEDQQIRFPGDLGFEFQEQLQEMALPFGPQPDNIPQQSVASRVIQGPRR